MNEPTSYEDGLVALRAAWSNPSILDENQGAMFALRNMRYDPDRFRELLAAMRAMPRAEQHPTLEVIQLVWRMPAQMMLYRDYFPECPLEYDKMSMELLTEATQIIGVVLDQA